MDKTYMVPKLKKLSKLLYKGECYSKQKKDGRYVFGDENNKNVVTKQIAMYICANYLPKKLKK